MKVRNVSKPLVRRLLGVVVAITLVIGVSSCSRFTDIGSVDAETVEVTGVAGVLVQGALDQVGKTTEYDPSYKAIAYPNGDIPLKTGVCSDVVVRAYRYAGMDLQRLLHEDMTQNFAAYPQRWGASQADANIDHRRVPNLAAFFKRQGGSLRVTRNGADYLPGDVVTWTIDGSPHTGIVSNKRKAGDDHFFIVNNRGAGARVEDVLFAWEITGHYRWLG